MPEHREPVFKEDAHRAIKRRNGRPKILQRERHGQVDRDHDHLVSLPAQFRNQRLIPETVLAEKTLSGTRDDFEDTQGLAFRDGFLGALSRAGAAIHALLGIYDALVALFRDRLDRASLDTKTATRTLFL